MSFKHTLARYLTKNAIAFDQQLNALLGGDPDETLSARAYRVSLKPGFRPSKVLQPVIDVLFLWQKPDEEVNAKAGRVITAHCERAFWKEVLRRELPPEYGKI